MTNFESPPRRTVLQAVGGTALAASLAGCGGSSEPEPVTVMVGAGNGLAFEPAEIEIETGTTVIWEWTGEGGEHNVVATDDAFASHEDGNVESEAGYTYEYTFDTAGTYEYECIPHSANGMVGTVVVE
ncbi:halocyanin domain-containing protein [Halonotius terrestris]|uniref:Halocyanin domain-containing protein n=1 Tax=Halonotius terrestris TaxID=2487750 RepID=A0A8J8PAS4_9EURY|nr:halocyanin domain-containing protein [Halonotius terrestris]TQQ79262.1 halocyanin domain-containing protein [Halonotius terrestris]